MNHFDEIFIRVFTIKTKLPKVFLVAFKLLRGETQFLPLLMP